MAMSGYPRRPTVEPRLGARGTQSLTSQLRLILEPKCPRTRLATAGEDPRDGTDLGQRHEAVCGFRYLASNATPFFHTIQLIVAIFRARVRRAISGLIPFATRAS